MKKIIIILSIALGALTFTSCEKENALTPNANFIQNSDTTDMTVGGGSAGGGTSGLPAGFLASTTPSNRAALLEDFTGVRCGFCPDGHVKAASAQQTLGPENFIIMAVHAGSYAAPSTGWANFTTPYGAALVAQADVAGYPAGTINRLPASSLGVSPQLNGSAMSRGSWETAGAAVNAMESPVNIGAKAIIDASNNLEVKVDLYYTKDEVDANNITVALLQNGLVSNQSGGGQNYVQNHVLRDLITGQWGEVVTESTDSADFVQKTFNYAVPADYNGTTTEGGGAVVINDLRVVVFVTRGQTDVLTAIKVDVE